MKHPALIDLHCDTLTHGTPQEDTLDDSRCALTLTRLPQGLRWAQLYAVFLPDEVRGAAAVAYYERYRDSFYRQMARFSAHAAPCRSAAQMERAWAEGKTAAFLSVENGSVLAGDPARAAALASDGVCAVTLTWNGENELGSGSATNHGLTPCGREAVCALERAGILVDASHLNDRGLAELLEVAERPFLATHSNARACCAHPRNLPDDAIRALVRRGCLIGLNYCADFLREDGVVQSLDVLYRHAAHFLELGGAANLALGSDFDGAVVPDCLSTPDRAASFYEYLLARGVAQETADGVFFRNAQTFLRKNLRVGERDFARGD